ncbi:aldo/keto reductase [Thiolapillus brandeum]|uniref:Aldo/keto reductase family oxidoreductase n=1 Tax=Thiolapillus brandeum TaxID=1076588 RepID=A0A7U6JGN2_9GAMM|nr:aldo/keto reductase [Thiolapillus brandeum]BAO43072.1 aldo/keto reductase family oxidoreductase [Thiolapillus brandeum]
MELRPLGSTGIQVSPLGLGTVKFGRNQQVKYPKAFEIPDDARMVHILEVARELGINLLDTAPAYGTAQERLGKLMPGPRDSWVIVSKVGEIFENGRSRFDFSHAYTRTVVEQSLKALNTDYLDCVLIHSDGDDLRILEQEGALDALRELKEKGLIRAHGMSSKTVEGGLRVVRDMDLVMATANLEYADERPVLEAAHEQHKGVLIKKGLMSGHVQGREGVRTAMEHVFSLPGVSSMIVGTIDEGHLRQNAALAETLT